MKTNVGGIDRIVRLSAGVLLVGLALAGVGTPWTWIGILPLATGVVGICPAYLPFGLSTCPAKKHA